jgi:hypothetical protein
VDLVPLVKLHACKVGGGVGVDMEFDLDLAFSNFRFCPDFTGWKVVECGNDIGNAGRLLNIAYRYYVFWAKPPHAGPYPFPIPVLVENFTHFTFRWLNRRQYWGEGVELQ